MEFSEFKGFSKETLNFLTEIKLNNSKVWFEGHKNQYNEYLLNPLQQLTINLAPLINSIDPNIQISAKAGKTISRIYRDIRFSNDKSLYRDNAWISFKRKENEQVSYPEFYFYFTPTHYEYGMGYYCASKKMMDKFREILEDDPKEFEQSISFFNDKNNKLEISGEEYKKVIKNSAKEELQIWFKFKTFSVSTKNEIDDIFLSQDIEKEIRYAFEKLKPLYCFLLEHTTDND
jgi:uncharacterized protein (TIGR02453 family)